MREKRKTEYTLAELAEGLDVTIQGDPQCIIRGVCTIQDGIKGQIAFLMNPLYKKYLSNTAASAVILLQEDAENCPVNALICRDPYYIYARIATYFDDKPYLGSGVHPTAVVGEGCKIDASASIGPHCVIGNHVNIGPRVTLHAGCVVGDFAEIGEESYFHPNVTVCHRTSIGKRVMIASGTVIGSDGFGMAKHRGQWHKVPQLGRVVIEDDVEIGANCAIDRGAIGDTVIEKGAKLDNLIQIGHNVRIGENTAIAAFVGVSGSTDIGKNGLIGGQAGFAGHLTIADNVVVTGGTAVSRSIREPGIYSSGVGGVVTNKEWRKNSARFNRLEKLVDRIKTLEAELVALKERKII